MLIGIPREPNPEQTLVAGTPDSVKKLIKLGYEVVVESGAGEKASYFDDAYEQAGARVVEHEEAWGADIVVCLDTPPDPELALIKRGATLIARMNPGAHPEDIAKFEEMGITALAMDMVPRLSRSQSLDVRSSMANVGGYRAVIEAANVFGRLFTGQVTAAARCLRLASMSSALASRSCGHRHGKLHGAEVSATDVRAEVADQVESLGATFVEIPVKQESSDGYAKALDEDEQARVLKVYEEQAGKNDIVITTAQVPGRPAPLLLTEEAVAGMKPGSVVVDMGASPLGGNCALSKPGEVIITDNGVTIIGYTDLPGRLPGQASQLYGQNIVNFFKLATPDKDGVLVLDEDDEVIRGITVTLDGTGMWPPPAVSVSAAPKKEEAPAEAMPGRGAQEEIGIRQVVVESCRGAARRGCRHARAAFHDLALRRARARHRRGLLRDRRRFAHAAHPAHVGDQRNFGHHHRGRDPAHQLIKPRGHHTGIHCHGGGLHQHLRRLSGDASNAQDVREEL